MKNHWKDLYAKLDIKGGDEGAKPTDAMLDRFQKTYDFTLPDGYRSFAKVFGPGEISAYVRIYTPGRKGSPGDLAELVDMVREGADVLGEAYGDAALVGRMMPFADTIGGDTIVWDPEKVTDAASHEYAILLLPRDSDKIKRVADSVAEFIDTCLSSTFGKSIGVRNFEPVMSFIPFAAMDD